MKIGGGRFGQGSEEDESPECEEMRELSVNPLNIIICYSTKSGFKYLKAKPI